MAALMSSSTISSSSSSKISGVTLTCSVEASTDAAADGSRLMFVQATQGPLGDDHLLDDAAGDPFRAVGAFGDLVGVPGHDVFHRLQLAEHRAGHGRHRGGPGHGELALQVHLPAQELEIPFHPDRNVGAHRWGFVLGLIGAGAHAELLCSAG
jgi:hypothetical protein